MNVLDILNYNFASENREPTTKTAKLGRIIWRQKFYNMRHASPYDFICLYLTNINPEYVLQPNVSLYSITNKEAVFVETPLSVNIYSSDVHPFFFVAQFLNATNVIKMSLKDFEIIAEKVCDPTVPVIWVSNTGRCGGTLLCQVFESVPGILVINEPDTPTNVYQLCATNKILNSDYESMLKSIIRITCKNHLDITCICIKTRPMCSAMVLDIPRLGLDIKQIFMYRNCLDTVKSVLAVMVQDPEYDVTRFLVDLVWFSKLFPYFKDLLIYRFATSVKTVADVPQNKTTACIFTWNWANQVLIAREAMTRDKSILSVRYEDILTRTMDEVERIFSRLGIQSNYVDRTIAALGRDSQRGSVLSRDKLEDYSNRSLSAIDRSRCDDILLKNNLPPTGAGFWV